MPRSSSCAWVNWAEMSWLTAPRFSSERRFFENSSKRSPSRAGMVRPRAHWRSTSGGSSSPNSGASAPPAAQATDSEMSWHRKRTARLSSPAQHAG